MLRRGTAQPICMPHTIREAPACHTGVQWEIGLYGPHCAKSAGLRIGRLRLPLGVPSERATHCVLAAKSARFIIEHKLQAWGPSS